MLSHSVVSINELGIDKKYDVIILGGGPAGLSAALWCDDLGLKTILVEANCELGGQLLWVHNPIENHLGIIASNGREMRDIFLKQIEKCKMTLKLGTEINKTDLEEKTLFLENDEKLMGKSIIIATGIKRKTLNIQGEKEFMKKGILESGRAEQKLIQGKTVAVIGGGDAALENALILAKTARKVYLIHRGNNFRARKNFIDQVNSQTNIQILTETTLHKISGDEQIRAIEINNRRTNKTTEILIDALLIRIGIEPNTKLFFDQIDLNENGYIKIDTSCQTNLQGVFAIGDVANSIAPTISSAIGMGATAVKAISTFFN